MKFRTCRKKDEYRSLIISEIINSEIIDYLNLQNVFLHKTIR